MHNSNLSGLPGEVRPEQFQAVIDSERRRRLLRVLARTVPGQELTLVGAARKLAAGQTVEDADDDRRVDVTASRSLYLDLYYGDVPKLEAVDLIEYDDESGRLRVTESGVRLDDELADVFG